jgi:hypothetical protein
MRAGAKLTRAVRLRAAGQVSGALLLTAKGGNGVFRNDRVSTVGRAAGRLGARLLVSEGKG